MKLIRSLTEEEVRDISYRYGLDDFDKTLEYLRGWSDVFSKASDMLLSEDTKRIHYMQENMILTEADMKEYLTKVMKTYNVLNERITMESYVRKRAAIDYALRSVSGNSSKTGEVMNAALSRINDPMSYISDLIE